MPEQIQVSETYLGWRGWHPARKKRLVTKWRYQFATIEVQSWGIFSIITAYETGHLGESKGKYTVWEWKFNQIGERVYYDQVMIFDRQLRMK